VDVRDRPLNRQKPDVKIGLQSRLRLVRTGGLYTIVVVRASLTTINFMLAFSLFG